MSNKRVTGSFTGTGKSDPVVTRGDLGRGVSARASWADSTTATVSLERAFLSHTPNKRPEDLTESDWQILSRDSAGAKAEYTDDFDVDIEGAGGAVALRLNCSAHTTGTVTYTLTVHES